MLRPFLQEARFRPGAVLYTEGETADAVYFIEEGTVDLLQENHFLSSIGAGEAVGESAAVLEGKVHGDTAIAAAPTRCIVFDIAGFRRSSSRPPEVNHKLAHLFVEKMAAKIGSSQDQLLRVSRDRLRLAETRLRMGQFLVCFLIGISVFFFVVRIIAALHLQVKIHTFVTVPLLIILFSFAILFIQVSGYPLSFFGLTWRNSGRAVVEALLWTPPLIALLIGLKWLLIQFVPDLHGAPLFKLSQVSLDRFDWLTIAAGAIAYPLFVPLQELLARGILQGCLENFLVGEKKTALAIILSNLIFSTLHLQISVELALITLFIGLIWGRLYARHHTIVGISLSHMLVGVIGFFVIGLF